MPAEAADGVPAARSAECAAACDPARRRAVARGAALSADRVDEGVAEGGVVPLAVICADRSQSGQQERRQRLWQADTGSLLDLSAKLLQWFDNY